MKHPITTVLLLLGVALSGCVQPTTAPPQDQVAEAPTPHAPTPIPLVVESTPGSEAPMPQRWWVDTYDWSPTLPRTNATLDLSIRVRESWGPSEKIVSDGLSWPGDWTFRPFDGEGWIFRMHVENGTYNSTEIFQPPKGADWFRSYNLTGIPDLTLSHPTSFLLGDLHGESVIVRLTYYKVFENGVLEAWEDMAWYLEEEDGSYHFDGWPSGQIVCSFQSVRCPGIAERGWLVYPDISNRVLPARDAVLDLSIMAVDEGAMEPLDGDGWKFRLSAPRDSPFGGSYYNGTVKPPESADWKRAYTLEGLPAETCSFQDREMDCIRHPTSFSLGDLGGSPIYLRLDYHKLFDDGHWEAWYAFVRMDRQGDEYYPREEGGARLECNSETGYGRCPWYDEYGEGPPPDDW